MAGEPCILIYDQIRHRLPRGLNGLHNTSTMYERRLIKRAVWSLEIVFEMKYFSS